MKKDPAIYCRILTARTRNFYASIGSIYCPALKEMVIFNAKGFHHLLFESDHIPRSVKEKIYKLTLLPLAIPVIKNATIVFQERNVQVRSSRKKDAFFKSGKTYALVAVVGNKNPIAVRVILLQMGNGKLMFRSIMRH